jgi:hypothetical protein
VNVVALRKEWVEVWLGTLDDRPTWFVEYYFDGGGLVVSECATEAEAVSDARDYDLPVIRI